VSVLNSTGQQRNSEGTNKEATDGAKRYVEILSPLFLNFIAKDVGEKFRILLDKFLIES